MPPPETVIGDEPESPLPPPPVPESKALFLAVSPVFGQHAGAVWSLTAAQAATGGDALQPLTDDPAQRKFVLAAWGRAPLVRD